MSIELLAGLCQVHSKRQQGSCGLAPPGCPPALPDLAVGHRQLPLQRVERLDAPLVAVEDLGGARQTGLAKSAQLSDAASLPGRSIFTGRAFIMREQAPPQPAPSLGPALAVCRHPQRPPLFYLAARPERPQHKGLSMQGAGPSCQPARCTECMLMHVNPWVLLHS